MPLSTCMSSSHHEKHQRRFYSIGSTTRLLFAPAAIPPAPLSAAAIPPPPSKESISLYNFKATCAPSDVGTFCFFVDLDTIPDPPPEGQVDLDLAKQNNEKNVFSIGDFVATIPTFFVPVEEVLKNLEGYTDEHIELYFRSSRSVQIVTIGSAKFIRLFGGYTNLDMSGSYEAAQLYPQYAINPELALPYIKCFQNIRNKWMPLKMLLEKGGKSLEEQLPFQGPTAILFFAQLQNVFSFAPDHGGAVMLRDAEYDQLDCDTSPCPAAISEVVNQIDTSETYPLATVIDEFLSDDNKAEILRFFSSIEEGLRRHGKAIYIDENGLVMRMNRKRQMERQKMTLEQQLELALQSRDKKKARILRRKIEMRNNPDNPLLDRDNAAREVFNFIPQRGYIALLNLTTKALPLHLIPFLGGDHIRFLKSYPQYFQVYELGEATRWCVSRAGVPLPQGVIRVNYSEDEIVRIIASVLQNRGKLTSVRISLYLPDGCREIIKRHFNSVYTVVSRYPKYFSVMKRSETTNAEASAMVSVITMPLEGEVISGCSTVYDGRRGMELTAEADAAAGRVNASAKQ